MQHKSSCEILGHHADPKLGEAWRRASSLSQEAILLAQAQDEAGLAENLEAQDANRAEVNRLEAEGCTCGAANR